MDSLFFEYRDYFLKRIQQLEPTTNGHKLPETEEPFRERPETSVCVRIRPLTEHERENNHIEAVLGHELGVANIYEPKKKFNGKPELNVRQFLP
jgi:kinesin family protein 2/24